MIVASEPDIPLWNQMTPEWRASIRLNGCITNPCLIGDHACPCWVAAQRLSPPPPRQGMRHEDGQTWNARAW